MCRSLTSRTMQREFPGAVPARNREILPGSRNLRMHSHRLKQGLTASRIDAIIVDYKDTRAGYRPWPRYAPEGMVN